jgi:DNA polymerase
VSPTEREELAAIARATRRWIERERAAGAEELIARAAKVEAALSERAPGPPAPPVAPSSPAPARVESAPAGGAASPSAPAGVDLFGNAVAAPKSGDFFAAAAAAAAAQAPALAPLPPIHPPLAARDLDARAAIHAAALPVLDEVASQARACTRCALCETRTHAVPGVGSARTGIVFVGEAPGADEDAQGEPFVGRAGQLLTRIIAAMDEAKLIPGVKLDRDSVYICNVLKCRPPENRNPLPHEIESCSPYLERQLAAIQPRIICCLGKFAAELLVGVKGTIAGLRGSVYRYRSAKLIVTYHPAACLRNPGYKRPVWEDMQLLAREYLSD